MKAKKNPFENPVVGILNTLAAEKDLNLSGEQGEWRKDKFNDKTDTGFTIDTCVGFDTGLWETGIAPPGKPWVIVEQYDSREEAQSGHAKWINEMKERPDQKLKD